MFDLELENVSQWVSDRGFSSVAIQLPEGLKIRAPEISSFITEHTGASVIIIGRPCYGACDLFDYRGWADGLVHYGHSPIPSMGDDPNVMFVESRSDAVLSEDIRESLSQLPQKIGLIGTVQYLGQMEVVRMMLESLGKEAFVGDGDARICHPGQILGCNCSAAESIENDVDCFLFLGEGDFHPLAASFGIGKQMYVLNPVTSEIREVTEQRDRIIRRRFAAIQSSRDAKSFLIVVCSKKGQCRVNMAKRVRKMIEETGRSSVTVVMEEVNPDALMSYDVDAYVCTACPRVAMDDSVRYRRPFLTVPELEIALGLKEWDEYPFDQIRGDQDEA